MSAAIFVVAILVWLVAAYAVVRIVMAWLAVTNLSPSSQKMDAALALGRFNFPEVTRIAGEAASPAIASFQKAVKLFLLCLIPFLGLILLNALSGTAA